MSSYFKPLKDELRYYLDKQQIKAVFEAYTLAEEAHEHQKRHTGEPYITHPVAVAINLAHMRLDYQTIIAAILHDVIEDTKVTKEDLRKQFGEDVAELVDGVSKLTQITFESRERQNAENYRKMFLAMAKDIRVILIKLADRLHNMRTLGAIPLHKRARIAKETLEIYAPIANRLGMHQFRLEFEELGFANLYPERYRVLRQAVRRARGNRKEIISTIEQALRMSLDRLGILHYDLAGREKHLYSIYKKMRAKHLSFSEVMDIYGFRIVVDNMDACYRVLGVAHNLYKPITQRFKDYISIPKANGYQSLHTTLFGPYGVPVEMQIRTREMDRIAESGVAAHWIYKSSQKDFSQAHLQAREWMKDVLELQENANTSLEFVESVKTDLFPDEVYVFSPKGQIIKLPQGATAVDFAYAIHSDIGNTCVAVKIDRHLAPLFTPLQSGQTIEIITSVNAVPNSAWLNFVITGKARATIRHFLKNQHYDESVLLGERLLQQALESLQTSIKAIHKKEIAVLLKKYQFRKIEELYADIGLGNRNALLVAQQLTDAKVKEGVLPHEALSIKGTEGMAMSFATCCRPIPGDSIVGLLDKGQGIVVHREACARLVKLEPNMEHYLSLRWEETISTDFLVEVVVEIENRRGILAGLAIAIADADSNIDNINAKDYDGKYFVVHLTLEVKNRKHLADVFKRVKHVPGLLAISRVKYGVKNFQDPSS